MRVRICIYSRLNRGSRIQPLVNSPTGLRERLYLQNRRFCLYMRVSVARTISAPVESPTRFELRLLPSEDTWN